MLQRTHILMTLRVHVLRAAKPLCFFFSSQSPILTISPVMEIESPDLESVHDWSPVPRKHQTDTANICNFFLLRYSQTPDQDDCSINLDLVQVPTQLNSHTHTVLTWTWDSSTLYYRSDSESNNFFLLAKQHRHYVTIEAECLVPYGVTQQNLVYGLKFLFNH